VQGNFARLLNWPRYLRVNSRPSLAGNYAVPDGYLGWNTCFWIYHMGLDRFARFQDGEYVSIQDTNPLFQSSCHQYSEFMWPMSANPFHDHMALGSGRKCHRSDGGPERSSYYRDHWTNRKFFPCRDDLLLLPEPNGLCIIPSQ
jgi:hypothetical protein